MKEGAWLFHLFGSNKDFPLYWPTQWNEGKKKSGIFQFICNNLWPLWMNRFLLSFDEVLIFTGVLLIILRLEDHQKSSWGKMRFYDNYWTLKFIHFCSHKTSHSHIYQQLHERHPLNVGRKKRLNFSPHRFSRLKRSIFSKTPVFPLRSFRSSITQEKGSYE